MGVLSGDQFRYVNEKTAPTSRKIDKKDPLGCNHSTVEGWRPHHFFTHEKAPMRKAQIGKGNWVEYKQSWNMLGPAERNARKAGDTEVIVKRSDTREECGRLPLP